MSILEHTTAGHAVPTFSIFKQDGSGERVDSLLACFFDRLTLDIRNPPAIIKARDGWVYTAVYDSQLPQKDKVEVLVSFQKHTYGRFAIIRVANESRQWTN